MKVVNGHLTEEQIEKYAMGKLSPVCCEDLEEHLLICNSCQLALEETDIYLTHMKAASARAEEANEHRTMWSKFGGGLPHWVASPLPAFAGLACAAAIFLVLYVPHPAPQKPQELTLESLRGGQLELPLLQAKRPVQLKLDATGLAQSSSYAVNIVDESGHLVFESAASRSQDAVVVRSELGLSAGKFLVRILDSKQQLLREFAISVK